MNPEDLLTDAFRDRTEHTDYPSTPMSTVARRAGVIRARRRRTTVLAAAAAVAAVAVPSALWLGRSPASSPQPSHELSSSPSQSPTQRASAPPTTDLASLPKGAPPGIDYLAGDVYHAMGGGRTATPAFASASTAALGRGGILTATPRPGSSVADLALVVNGAAQPLGCGAEGFALSTDRTQSAYWVKGTCSGTSGGRLYGGVTNTMGQAGPGYVATPPGEFDLPVGIVQQGVVVNRSGGTGSTPAIVAWDGTTTSLSALARALGSDENADVVSGVLDPATGTGGVVDAQTGAVRWRAPEGWALGQFSSDGTYVLGEQSTQPGGHAVFDTRTHRLVTRLDVPAGVSLQDVVWDTGDSVLARAATATDQAILRFDLQGHVTRATPVHQGTDYYRFATRP